MQRNVGIKGKFRLQKTHWTVMFTLNFLFEAKSLICRENKNCTLYTTFWFGEGCIVEIILKFPAVGSLFVRAYCYRLGLELCIFQADQYHYLWGFQNIGSNRLPCLMGILTSSTLPKLCSSSPPLLPLLLLPVKPKLSGPTVALWDCSSIGPLCPNVPKCARPLWTIGTEP